MSLRFLSLYLAVLTSSLWATPYEFGHGFNLHDSLTAGGYISTEFESNQQADTFTIDDVAVMAYGNIGSNFSYLAELEAVGFYHKNITDGNEGGAKNSMLNDYTETFGYPTPLIFVLENK